MRARMAVLASGISCELREVVLRDKPAVMLTASPKGTVPVLVLPDRVIDESLDIAHWALVQNDPKEWMKPETGTPEAMSELIAENDGPFKASLDRYKYPNRYDENVIADEQRDKACSFLTKLETRLEKQTYLFGQQAHFADIAIFPFVRQFAHVDRDWFETAPFPNTQKWLSSLTQSSFFESSMKKYPQWTPDAPAVYFP